MSELGEFESFEKRKRLDERGMEYWSARDFASYLGYEMPKAWENFLKVLEKAKETAKSVKLRPKDHILGVKDMVLIGSKAKREIGDYRLSRYACYIVAQQADPRKIQVAKFQTYLALATRAFEEKVYSRLEKRDKSCVLYKMLSSVAKKKGVVNFASFQDKGNEGLYGDGYRSREIAKAKGVSPRELRNRMSSTELDINNLKDKSVINKLKAYSYLGQKPCEDLHYQTAREFKEFFAKQGLDPLSLALSPPIKKVGKDIAKINFNQ